jgi:hypothetical protein
VTSHHCVVIVGATGLGKTYIACALVNAAIRRGHSALYLRRTRLHDEIALSRDEGRLARLLGAWARVEGLVLDDFLLRPLAPDQAADVLEVIEDRIGLRSTIVTSQLPVAMWHDALGEPTIADGILDRLLERVHRNRTCQRVPAARRPAQLDGNTRASAARRRRSTDHQPSAEGLMRWPVLLGREKRSAVRPSEALYAVARTHRPSAFTRPNAPSSLLGATGRMPTDR